MAKGKGSIGLTARRIPFVLIIPRWVILLHYPLLPFESTIRSHELVIEIIPVVVHTGQISKLLSSSLVCV